MSLIHPTAIIGEQVIIAAGVAIGAYAIIQGEVTIGEGCVIEPHVIISGPTFIGKNNRFFQFGSIGAEPQYKNFMATDYTTLVIGDNNTFRENVTINRGTAQDRGETLIGDDNLIMASVHIAHDCVIGNHCVFANASALAGHVTIHDWAILGGYTLVHQYCQLGEHSFCGMGSAVSRDVPNFVTVSGNLAVPHGINIKGIKGRGFDKEQIVLIKKSYRALYRQDNRLEAAIDEIKLLDDEQETLSNLVQFLQNSSRGIVR